MNTKRMAMMPAAVLLAVEGALFCFASAVNAQPPQYTVTNLGTLGGTYSESASINNLGQVVGRAALVGNFVARATLFSGTGSNNTDLGILDGGADSSFAFGINDAGQIVGDAAAPSGFFRPTLFSGTGTGNLDLGSVGGTGGGRANHINNAGQIVGYSADPGNNGHATLFSGTGTGNVQLGSTTTFPSLIATSINNVGQIVGEGWTEMGGQRAVLISVGSQIDLGDLGGWPNYAGAQAYGNNDLGQIVGRSSTSSGAGHATLFSGTGSGNLDLGALYDDNSWAISINNAGQVVGNTGMGSNIRGFVYVGGTMYDLNNLVLPDSGVSDIRITDGDGYRGRHINEWGQISAVGTTSGGQRALRLDPVDPLTTTGDGGANRNTKFLSGMDYSQFTPTTNPGNLGTTVELLGGTVGSAGSGTFGLNRDVAVLLHPGDPLSDPIASDVVELTGTESDIFVLQISYDPTLVANFFGGETQARLGWFDGEQWALAVDGNSTGEATFVEGPWNADYSLGFHGVDTSSHTVWAVLDHNSTFAVIPVPIPEPANAALLALALPLVACRLRSTRTTQLTS